MDSTAGRRREKISTHLKKKLLWVLRARQADTGAGQTEKYKGHARGVISDRGQPDNKVTQLGQKVWIYPLDTVAAPQHRTFLRYWDPKILCNEPLSSTLSVSWVFKLCGWVWAWAGIGSHGVNCAMSFVAAVVVFLRSASAIQASCTSLTYITDQVGHWVHIGPWQIDFEPSLIWLCCCQGGYISVINKLFTK